jgi:hypothetical protein
MGRKYWKKKSYLFQGFVRENPLNDEKAIDNPIRRFIIGPQIFNLVKNALMDPELENMPTDYEGGLDFNVKKTSKGGYADYSTSTWARKESALTQAERDAIEKFGLYNLADFLPKKPSEQELKIIKEMFEASVNGEPFDMDRWGAYFKPAGMMNSGSTNRVADEDAPAVKPVAQNRPAPVSKVEDDEPPFDVEDTPTPTAPVQTAKPASQRAEDILAMIRNRQKS